jgi:hypothetical protein
MDEHEAIAKAKDYIANGQYEAAKVVLEKYPRNSVAIALLQDVHHELRLRTIKQSRQQEQPRSEQKRSEQKRSERRRSEQGQGGGAPAPVVINNINKKEHEIPRVALIIIVVSMVLWSIAIIAYALVTPNPRNVPIAGLVAILLGGNLFVFFLYWLFWKFYWWMLALGWLMVSCVACTALATLPQYLASLGIRF